MASQFMTLIRNSQGRPCAWGVSDTRESSSAEAERQWGAYRLDPGEFRGRTDTFEGHDFIDRGSGNGTDHFVIMARPVARPDSRPREISRHDTYWAAEAALDAALVDYPEAACWIEALGGAL